ncbi:hypothetical protein GWJ21_04085 [Bacillus coagulans]|uniref:Bacteriophage Gp15 protein n=1 Tax=Heyndrickxia coagulans TaxID=1398 RepID=A0A150KIR1_HEYCO|nr:Gp15 family bacteriophage protein [Heyndrickxia coagulans]KYC72291.1 hypothetical protein B4099_3653 [Heyndrickxia coagulans]NCG67145.1 hypothetical protein [Heyndrickxia coagulans]
MLSLTQPLENEIEINGQHYEWDLSYDNVLRFYELMDDDSVNEIEKVQIAFKMFVPECIADIETQIETVQAISKYVSGQDEEESEPSEGSHKQYYSWEQDADYIYASFLQDYGIDLIDLQGTLRWEKFIAMLNSLSERTKFSQVVSIRAAEIPAGNSEYEIAERNRLIQLKDLYALKGEDSVSYAEQEIDSMFDRLVESAQKGGETNE